jgi:hypothetical protein
LGEEPGANTHPKSAVEGLVLTRGVIAIRLASVIIGGVVPS